MTNTPTIDGVSRETAVIALRLITRELETLANGSAIQRHKAALSEIRALLDAPVVERQPDAELLVEFFEHGPMATIKWFTPSSFEHGATKVYTAPPEVAALQSTIAQLQAENSRVNDAWHDMKRELDLTKARVAELESGRGEVERYDRYYQGAWFEVAADDVERFEKDGWKIRRLYTAPPAPVAVDEHAAFEKWVAQYVKDINYNWPELALKRDGDCYATTWVDSAYIGWQARACLDATAALNEVRK